MQIRQLYANVQKCKQAKLFKRQICANKCKYANKAGYAYEQNFAEAE